MTFADASFDAVMSNSIVHHIPKPDDALAEMLRVLRPGGFLFVRDLLRPGAISEQEILKQGVRYLNPIVEWPGARAFGLSADLLIEALRWGTGEELERGARRLADLESRRDSL